MKKYLDVFEIALVCIAAAFFAVKTTEWATGYKMMLVPKDFVLSEAMKAIEFQKEFENAQAEDKNFNGAKETWVAEKNQEKTPAKSQTRN